MGSQKPEHGTEIQNKALASALQAKLKFTKEELELFFSDDPASAPSSYDCYIKVQDRYYRPFEAASEPEAVQEHLDTASKSGANGMFLASTCAATEI